MSCVPFSSSSPSFVSLSRPSLAYLLFCLLLSSVFGTRGSIFLCRIGLLSRGRACLHHLPCVVVLFRPGFSVLCARCLLLWCVWVLLHWVLPCVLSFPGLFFRLCGWLRSAPLLWVSWGCCCSVLLSALAGHFFLWAVSCWFLVPPASRIPAQYGYCMRVNLGFRRWCPVYGFFGH